MPCELASAATSDPISSPLAVPSAAAMHAVPNTAPAWYALGWCTEADAGQPRSQVFWFTTSARLQQLYTLPQHACSKCTDQDGIQELCLATVSVISYHTMRRAQQQACSREKMTSTSTRLKHQQQRTQVCTATVVLILTALDERLTRESQAPLRKRRRLITALRRHPLRQRNPIRTPGRPSDSEVFRQSGLGRKFKRWSDPNSTWMENSNSTYVLSQTIRPGRVKWLGHSTFKKRRYHFLVMQFHSDSRLRITHCILIRISME